MGDVFRTLVSSLASRPCDTYPLSSELMGALTNLGQVQFGTYTGTGVAISVTTLGNPRLVILYDVTQQCLGIHISGMTAATYFQIDNAAVGAVGANGITLGTNGFTIGTDAGINTNLDSGFWLAII